MTALFKNKINNADPVLHYLPIFHTTDGFGFRSIIENMTLTVKNCHVFKNETLFYTFYGKPAYRIKSKLNYSDISRFPICFMFVLPIEAEIYKIFPFDSGAFNLLDLKIKEKYFHPKNTLIDFELGQDLTSIKKFIKFFYGSNHNYLNSILRSKIPEIKVFDFELNSYFNLVKDQSGNMHDDRMKVIEISYNTELKITRDNLIKVILPNNIMMDDEFIDKVTSYIPIERFATYNASYGAPIEFQKLVEQLALEFTKKYMKWKR